MRRELAALALVMSAVGGGAACGGAVVFDGPWPSGSGGAGGSVGLGGVGGVGASDVVGAGAGIGAGGSSTDCTTALCSESSAGACDCTGSCGTTLLEVSCSPASSGFTCDCIEDGTTLATCAEMVMSCDVNASCCGTLFAEH